MTVGELIKELSKYPEDQVVVLDSSGIGYETCNYTQEMEIYYLDGKSTTEDTLGLVLGS